MKKIFSALKSAGKDFSDDECMVSGAALAYYTIFSLPPMLVIVFLIAGWFGVEASKIDSLVKQQLGIPIEKVQPESQETAGASGGEQESASQGSFTNIAGVGLAMRIIGICVLIFSATGLFAQFQFALNRAWEVEPDPDQGGILNFVMKRLLSLGMVIIIAFLLLVSFVLTTMVDEMASWIQGAAPTPVMVVVGTTLNVLVTLILATLLFAALFKVLPDAKTSWRDLFIGAGMTALLFVIGKTAIGWYLQRSNISSTWGGAASSMVAILVWVYYTSLIVLFGAELAQVWANRYGDGIEPSEGAVKKVEEKRHIREGSRKPAMG